jgi:hypothetical protein
MPRCSMNRYAPALAQAVPARVGGGEEVGHSTTGLRRCAPPAEDSETPRASRRRRRTLDHRAGRRAPGSPGRGRRRAAEVDDRQPAARVAASGVGGEHPAQMGGAKPLELVRGFVGDPGWATCHPRPRPPGCKKSTVAQGCGHHARTFSAWGQAVGRAQRMCPFGVRERVRLWRRGIRGGRGARGGVAGGRFDEERPGAERGGSRMVACAPPITARAVTRRPLPPRGRGWVRTAGGGSANRSLLAAEEGASRRRREGRARGLEGGAAVPRQPARRRTRRPLSPEGERRE